MERPTALTVIDMKNTKRKTENVTRINVGLFRRKRHIHTIPTYPELFGKGKKTRRKIVRSEPPPETQKWREKMLLQVQ